MAEDQNKAQSGSKKSTDSVDIPEEGAVGGNKKGDGSVSRENIARKFFIPSGIATSPPQFVTLDEIMSAVDGVTNMCLAHEIAVEKDFRLEKYEPPQNSLEKVVKELMHKAFWDILVEELNGDPPQYNKAMVLLEEVKVTLLDLLLPHHTKIMQDINEVLDVPHIKQQAEHGTLDFLSYARYILGVMEKLCAPVRDEKINQLKEATDIVVLYKGIFEVLDLMKIDLANLHIQVMRPSLIANSVEYEKDKFAEALKISGGIESLTVTRKWLEENVQDIEQPAPQPEGAAIRDFANKVIPRAYLSLLEWEPPYPETLLMDTARLEALHHQVFRLTIVGSALLVTLSKINVPLVQSTVQFKERLRDHVSLLLQDVKTNRDLEVTLPNVVVQVLKETRKFLEENSFNVIMDDATEKSLTDLLLDVAKPEQPVRKLVRLRVREFLESALAASPTIPTQVPPGLSSLKSELLSTAATLINLYAYNRAVFGQYYVDIITQICQSVSE